MGGAEGGGAAEDPCWTHGGKHGVPSLPVTGDALRGKVPVQASAPPLCLQSGRGRCEDHDGHLDDPYQQIHLSPTWSCIFNVIYFEKTKKDDVRYVTTVNELAFLSAAEQFLLYTTFLMQ